MKWEQYGKLEFCIELTGERTVCYERAYEEAVRWCRDQFEQGNWTRRSWGTWRIAFIREVDATAFKLRWC